MAFNEKLPEWNATGVEPPTSKKNEGWQPDDKPPADWFNWLFNRAYKVLDEIRTILGGHVDAAAPHSGHETPAGATAKASAAETNAKGYTDTHAGAKDTHGTGAGYYIAKTSRSDQLPAYADVQDKPSSFPPSTHTHQGGDITSKVGSATVADAVPWAGVSDKPASFAPSAHKSTHVSGGADALTPADIGAATIGDLGGVQGDVTTLQGELATHLAEGVHQVVSATSADDATSAVNAPLKSVGGLAVAKKGWFGGKVIANKHAFITGLSGDTLHIPVNTSVVVEVSFLGLIAGEFILGVIRDGGGYAHLHLSFGGSGEESYFNVAELTKFTNSSITISGITKLERSFKFTLSATYSFWISYLLTGAAIYPDLCKVTITQVPS